MKNIIVLLFLITSSNVFAQNAVIFKGPYGKFLPNLGLEFKDGKNILSGVSYPPVHAVSAPAGSLYLERSGKLFVKLDSGLTTNWSMVQFASSALSDPTTTPGDLLYKNLASNLIRLPIGSVSQVLTVSGGIPQWATPAAGFSDPMTSIGDLIYRDGTNTTVRLPVGPVSYPLVSNGTIPVYASIPDVGFADPLTTRGDILYKNSANATTRLALGAQSFVLTSNGTDLVYASNPDIGFADPLTSAGDILYKDAANATTRLPVGPVSYPLVSNGTIPVYASIPDIGFADPMTTAGDLIVKNAANATTRLGIGVASQVLTVSGGIAQWVTPQSGFSDPLTTNGDLIARIAGATTRLGIGASSQILTVSGGIPAWTTPSFAVSNANWLVDAQMAGTANANITTTAVTTLSEATNSTLTLTNASHATVTALIACASGTAPSGSNCGGVNESFGINFNVPSDFSGNVEICATLAQFVTMNTGGTSSSNNTRWRIVETASNAVTPLYVGQANPQFYVNMINDPSVGQDFNDVFPVCGTFSVNAGDNKTYRLMYKKGANNNLSANGIQVTGEANVYFYVKPFK